VSTASAPVLDPPELGEVPDVRLIALDMDGSLLDEDKRLDPSFWPLLEQLGARGIVVCPASGRQYATLRAQFGRDDLVYIAENGAYVVRDGAELSADTLPTPTAFAIVGAIRDAAAGGLDLGTVVCGKRSAYVERTDEAFLAQVRPYYARLKLVDDLCTVDDDVLKVAVYDFESAELGARRALAPFEGVGSVVVSGVHWVDVMSTTADKGAALSHVQDALGISREQTMAFGDYFNDVGMLGVAAWSFAMDNGHPDVRAAARFVAPANTRNGVVRTIASALAIEL
jgi:Cof subfamily protein (haloacid dehalogenase superfamily)